MNEDLVKLETGIVKLGQALVLVDLLNSTYFLKGLLDIEFTNRFCTAKNMLDEAEDIINNSFYKYKDSNEMN